MLSRIKQSAEHSGNSALTYRYLPMYFEPRFPGNTNVHSFCVIRKLYKAALILLSEHSIWEACTPCDFFVILSSFQLEVTRWCSGLSKHRNHLQRIYGSMGVFSQYQAMQPKPATVPLCFEARRMLLADSFTRDYLWSRRNIPHFSCVSGLPDC